jgi:hypothetical protein
MSLQKYIDRVATCIQNFKDNRQGRNKSYTMKEIGMSAYSVFHMQSPSFLAHQQNMKRRKGEHNGNTLFGFSKIPSDNHIRQCLDHVDPNALAPFFENIPKEVDKAEWFIDGRLLIAIDGVNFFSSSKIHCLCCLKKEHSNGTITYSHAALCPVIVHPSQKQVLPLMPEFIKNEDGNEKQDCEINAAKRWIEANKEFLSMHKVILLADDLFSREQFIELIESIPEVDYIFVAKPSSHTYMYQWIADLDANDRLAITVSDKAFASNDHHYSISNGVPLNSKAGALKVSYLDMVVVNKRGKQKYHNSFVTSLNLTPQNIHKIACMGRNRWKIENEAFNVLKTKGYHLAHNFGHGSKNLANVLAILNIVAFTVHTLWQITNEIFHNMFNAFSSRKQFFQNLVSLTLFHLFDSWEHFLDFVKDGLDES